MPSTQTSTLGNFLSIFIILSILIWIISYVPKLKEGLRLVQELVINQPLNHSPLIGLVVFGVTAFIYFSYYYVSSYSLDDTAQKFISKFIFFWSIFITAIAVAAALLLLLTKSKK